MPPIRFPAFTVLVPDGWEDITDSLEDEAAPITLAREDGVGALQFSVSVYYSGESPDASSEQLLSMVEEFGLARELGRPGALATQAGWLRMAAGSFLSDGYFVRVWYVSDGLSFALVTYTCEAGRESHELAACEQIVGSLTFATPVRWHGLGP